MAREHHGAAYRFRVLGAALMVATSGVGRAEVAHAHGEYPQAEWVLVDPADPETIVVSATFGLIVTEDGGESWKWVCPVAAHPSGAFLDGRALLVPDRTILLGLRTGLAVGTALGCGLTEGRAPLGDTPVSDLSPVGGTPGHVYALTFAADGSTGLSQTDDGGQSWTPVDTAPPVELLGQGLRVASSDPSRIYVSGLYADDAAAVYRSDDGGETWQRFPVERAVGEFSFTPLGVSPTDPDRLYVLARGGRHDRVLRSDDGGAAFRDVAMLSAPPLTAGRHFGFVFDEDGTAWFGNTETGLWREGPDGATPVNPDLSVACLHMVGDELWACGDGMTDGFAVGRSVDGSGTAFTPVLRFADIAGIRDCGPGHPLAERCEPYWDGLQVQLGLATPDGGAPDVGGTGDPGGPGDAGGTAAGRSDAGTAPDAAAGGCSAAAPGAPGPTGTALASVAWLLVTCRSGRRRGRSRTCGSARGLNGRRGSRSRGPGERAPCGRGRLPPAPHPPQGIAP